MLTNNWAILWQSFYNIGPTILVKLRVLKNIKNKICITTINNSTKKLL